MRAAVVTGAANAGWHAASVTVLWIACFCACSAQADGQSATLQLDADSFISYAESANAPIPFGSTIRFRFGGANADGSIPVEVRAEDVSIGAITLGEDMVIEYTLGGTATGTLRSVAGGSQIELLATLVATLRDGSEAPPVAYELRFTTGTAQATNASLTETVSVDGVPVAASRHVRLVGAATNRPDAVPGPGEAVYAVLSGTFDWLPTPP